MSNQHVSEVDAERMTLYRYTGEKNNQSATEIVKWHFSDVENVHRSQVTVRLLNKLADVSDDRLIVAVVNPDKEPPEERIEVCPECNDSDIEPTNPHSHTEGPDYNWRCRSCETRFDDPTNRPPQSTTTHNPGTLARKLLDSDPDEVTSDD